MKERARDPISINPNEVPNERFAVASEVMKVLEAIVVGCDDGVTVDWKLGRRDDLSKGDGWLTAFEVGGEEG